MERVSGVDQLFIKEDNNGAITAMMAKVTAKLLMLGKRSEMKSLVEIVAKRLPASKTVIDESILFNGCTIRKEDKGDISMSMTEYLETIGYMGMERESRKQADEKVTDQEYTEFKYMAGAIMWLGGGVSPQASFLASYLQQRT